MSYTELDTCLNGNYGADNWADNVSEYAQELIQNFSSDDWESLENNLADKSSQWKDYLAQILPWGDAEKSIPVLTEMLSESDENIVISAADSLRDISENNQIVTIDAATAKKLKSFTRSVSPLSNRVITAFLESTLVKTK